MKHNPIYDLLIESDALSPETHSNILAMMNEINQDLIGAQEAYLERIFGNHENAKELAKFFVFEVRTDFPNIFNDQAYFDGDEFAFKVKQEYRIRLKTEEELRAEHVEEMLEELSKEPPICLTCRQPILGAIIESSYGAWHGAPATCVEGRD